MPEQAGIGAEGFRPLQVLAAAHRRADEHCAGLLRLGPHLAARGAERAARDEAEQIMRYFDRAARELRADEEIDLFPALIESMAGSDAVCLRELTALLAAEHSELERRWRRLRVAVEAVAGAGAAVLDAVEVQAFVDLQQRHIARERAELLPMAERLLTDAELDRIGLAMQARRRAGCEGGPGEPR